MRQIKVTYRNGNRQVKTSYETTDYETDDREIGIPASILEEPIANIVWGTSVWVEDIRIKRDLYHFEQVPGGVKIVFMFNIPLDCKVHIYIDDER